MSTISASTTTTTGLVQTSDTTGTLVLQTGAGPTTALTLDSSQNATFAGYANLPNTFGFKNRIINGAMAIDQRNSGAAQNALAGSASTYLVDRWYYYGTQAGKFNSQQNAGSVSVLAATGFKNYLGLTVASAVSVGASDYFNLRQAIEGFNTADLAWGTASAKTVTLSFWVYSSLTGTFGGVLSNTSFNRCYPYTYTVSSANTWTQISVTIAGDTSGTWATDNTAGVIVTFGLGAGATFSGTAGSWSGGTYASATGAVSVVGTNGATFYITGVQLEKGSTATSFDYRPYGTELNLCQRYLPCINAASASAASFANGYCYSSSAGRVFYTFQVQPRTTPTGITTTVASGFLVEIPGAATAAPTGIAFQSATYQGCDMSISSSAAFGVGGCMLKTNSSSAQIQFTGCEL